MARVCTVCGKGPVTGNNVSHAHNKTRRRYLPNLQPISFLSDSLGDSLRLRVATRAIRTVERHGGIDGYLMQVKDELLSPRAQRFKRKVAKARNEAAAKAG